MPGFGTSDPDSSLPTGFGRVDYELTQFLPLIVLFVVGVLFYVAGSGVRSQMVKVSLEDDQPIAGSSSST